MRDRWIAGCSVSAAGDRTIVARTFPAVGLKRDGERRARVARGPPCAPAPVQLRHQTRLTSEAYLAEHASVKASLSACPGHPRCGCRFARQGTYLRETPTGIRGPTAHETFSPLPNCLASRFPSDLDDLERVVTHVGAARSVEAAADTLRPDIDLAGAECGKHTSPFPGVPRPQAVSHSTRRPGRSLAASRSCCAQSRRSLSTGPGNGLQSGEISRNPVTRP
jgi:hypothetical protein